jgi:hypothetical protein
VKEGENTKRNNQDQGFAGGHPLEGLDVSCLYKMRSSNQSGYSDFQMTCHLYLSIMSALVLTLANGTML